MVVWARELSLNVVAPDCDGIPAVHAKLLKCVAPSYVFLRMANETYEMRVNVGLIYASHAISGQPSQLRSSPLLST